MDDITICNKALAGIGAQSSVQVIAPVPENSTEARQCALHYETLRRSLLREYRWRWAKRQIALALIAAAKGTPENPTGSGKLPPQPWAYEYAYPAQCVRLRYIEKRGSTASGAAIPMQVGQVNAFADGLDRRPIRFEEQGDIDGAGNAVKVVVTNQPQAVMWFTALVTDPNIYDDDFVLALVGRLAAAISPVITADAGMLKTTIQRGEQAEARAALIDAQEGNDNISHTASWIAARGAGDESVSYEGLGRLDGWDA